MFSGTIKIPSKVKKEQTQKKNVYQEEKDRVELRERRLACLKKQKTR